MQDLEILDEGFLVAPHLQTLQDREYTLAGKVNEDSLYVGGDIKAKLSLPVLSTLGAITSSSVVGDHKIFKHTNGTTLIKGGIYNLNKPDSRISMGIYADKDGLQYYNDANDPMPIKTVNMVGLQKWEETELKNELDKNIVLTTNPPQENSVPNTFLLESFESMRNYSPALTDAEIIEECALDVQPLFRNSNGIPNHLGEDLPTEDGRKALVIGGSYKSNLDAGVFYNSFEYDTNDQPDDVGTRVVYK